MASPVVVSRIQNRRGTQTQFNGLYPLGYNGVGGFESIPGYNITNYPNVLLSGEIALCTDSRRVFVGNINGEYLELSEVMSDGILLEPLVLTLPPSALFTVIPGLTYTATPFMKILYDITDSASADWNVVGTNFSRNGTLEITAVQNFTPAPPTPPFPAITPVSLIDTGVEINLASPDSITFQAQYDGTASFIQIAYTHDFSTSLTFSTSNIQWLPF